VVGMKLPRSSAKGSVNRIFDKQLLVKATHEAGLSSQEIVDYSEDHYKAQNFLDRLFGRSRTVAQMSTWVEAKDGVRITEQLSINEEQALGFVRKAVIAAHKMDDMVIVGVGDRRSSMINQMYCMCASRLRWKSVSCVCAVIQRSPSVVMEIQ